MNNGDSGRVRVSHEDSNQRHRRTTLAAPEETRYFLDALNAMTKAGRMFVLGYLATTAPNELRDAICELETIAEDSPAAAIHYGVQDGAGWYEHIPPWQQSPNGSRK